MLSDTMSRHGDHDTSPHRETQGLPEEFFVFFLGMPGIRLAASLTPD
jgi:hypothetical protein